MISKGDTNLRKSVGRRTFKVLAFWSKGKWQAQFLKLVPSLGKYEPHSPHDRDLIGNDRRSRSSLSIALIQFHLPNEYMTSDD